MGTIATEKGFRLRDWANRLPTGNLCGLVLKPCVGDEHLLPKPMALRFYSPGLAWFHDPATYPNGLIKHVKITHEHLLEWIVVGHATQDCAIYEGDTVIVDGRQYGLGEEVRARVVSISCGDASIYPIKVEAESRRMQFKPSEIKAVIRETQAP